MEEEFEWIAVSELAMREGCTAQTIRNKIKQGLYESMTFKRGKMNGTLVKVAKGQQYMPSKYKKRKRKIRATIIPKAKIVHKSQASKNDTLPQVPRVSYVPNNGAVFKVKIKRK